MTYQELWWSSFSSCWLAIGNIHFLKACNDILLFDLETAGNMLNKIKSSGGVIGIRK